MKKSQPSHRDCASFGNPASRTELGKNFPTDNVRRVNVALRVPNSYVLNDGASAAVSRTRSNHRAFPSEYSAHFTDYLAVIISDQHFVLLRKRDSQILRIARRARTR